MSETANTIDSIQRVFKIIRDYWGFTSHDWFALLRSWWSFYDWLICILFLESSVGCNSFFAKRQVKWEVRHVIFNTQLSHQHEMLKPYLPYNIDHGIAIRDPMMNNLFYLSVWAIAHSTFARHSVKVYVTKIIPRHLERPFYVFQASYLLQQGKS